MNKISNYRKVYGQTKVKEQEQPSLIRMSTNKSIKNKNQQDMQLISELKKCLQQQRQKNKELEDKVKQYQVRGMEKEKQFHKIIRQKSRQIFRFSKVSDQSDYIQSKYRQIIQNFEKYNQATNQVIQLNNKQSMNQMERRVQNIVKIMEEQLKNCKKLSNENIKQIRTQIQHALQLVRRIDQENIQLRMALNQYKNKLKILQNERQLLIQQLVNKKQIINKIYERNKQYKDIIKHQQENKKNNSNQKQTSFSHNNAEIQIEQNDCSKKLKTLQSTFNQIQIKDPYSNRKKFFQEPTLEFLQSKVKVSQNYLSDLNRSKCIDTNQKYLQSVSQNTSNKNILQKSKRSSMSGSQFKGKNSKLSYLMTSTKYNKSICQNKKNKSVMITNKPGLNQYLTTLTKKLDSCHKQRSEVIPKNQYQQLSPNLKSIQYLKSCLEKEKKKVAGLQKKLTKLKLQNDFINNEININLQQLKYRIQQKGGDIQNTRRFQLLAQQIKYQRSRLTICDQPPHYAWSQKQLNQAMQKLDQQVNSPKKS